MFGLGFPEILFILLVAILILGPEHTPRAARLIGKWSSKLRSAATTFNDAVTQDADLRELKDSLATVKTEIDSARNEIKKASNPMDEVSAETHRMIESARAELREIQAQTGRTHSQTNRDVTNTPARQPNSDSNRTGQDDVPPPVPSPFMSRPLGAFQTSEPVENTSVKSSGHRTIRLPKPVFLPERLSLMVTRTRVKLPVPSGGDSHRAVRLKSVHPHSAFCKVCRIPLPAHQDKLAQRIVRLDTSNHDSR